MPRDWAIVRDRVAALPPWHPARLALVCDSTALEYADHQSRYVHRTSEGRGDWGVVHFIPLHRQPYYRDRFGFQPADLPVADAAYERLVSLPLYTRMTERDVDDVIEAVRRVVQRNRW